MRFGEVEERAARKPLATVLVPATAWSDTWEKRPDDAVCIGIRLLSEKDIEVARSSAARFAVASHPSEFDEENRAEAMLDGLLRNAVAAGTCDPNDVTEPWGDFAVDPEGIVREALTPQGVRFLWDQIDRAMVEHSPSEPEATDEELDELMVLTATSLDKLPTNAARRVRRLLGHCLRQLRT